jgi:hypothetical protein
VDRLLLPGGEVRDVVVLASLEHADGAIDGVADGHALLEHRASGGEDHGRIRRGDAHGEDAARCARRLIGGAVAAGKGDDDHAAGQRLELRAEGLDGGA